MVDSEAMTEAKKKTKNIKELEDAGARILSDREKRENREELMDKLHELEKIALKDFEEYGSADHAIGHALLELGYKG